MIIFVGTRISWGLELSTDRVLVEGCFGVVMRGFFITEGSCITHVRINPAVPLLFGPSAQNLA